MNDIKRKMISSLITAIIMAMIVIITLSFGYMPPDPPIPESGVEVALGYSDLGFGNSEKVSDSPANTAPAPQPAAAANEYATQSTEEAVSLPSKTSPHPAAENQHQQETAKPQPETSRQPEFNKRADFANRKSNNTDKKSTESGNKGITAGDGAMGKPEGNANATSQTGSGGNGKGSGIGFSLAGRKALDIRKPDYKSNAVGQIVITIYVDRDGKVINAVAGGRGTTIFDKRLTDLCLASARNARFNASKDAAEKQQGTITYVFERTS